MTGDEQPATELADLADDVLREVVQVRRLYEQLDDALRRNEATASGLAAAREAGDETSAAHEVGERTSPTVAAGDSAPEPEMDAVRRIATTAALSGASRHEVEVYLREELGLEDSAAALDEVFTDQPPSTSGGH